MKFHCTLSQSKARARIAKHGAILKMGEQRKGNKETRQELPCVHDLPEVEALLAQNEHLSGHRLCLSINWWGTLCHTIVHWTLTGMSKRRVTKTFYNPITAIHPTKNGSRRIRQLGHQDWRICENPICRAASVTISSSPASNWNQ